MLSILVNFVFKIIATIGGIILTPITLIVSAFIPDFSNFISGIISFLSNMVVYVPFFIKLFMIPSFCISSVNLLFTAYLSLIVGIQGYKLVMKIYNKFKP